MHLMTFPHCIKPKWKEPQEETDKPTAIEVVFDEVHSEIDRTSK